MKKILVGIIALNLILPVFASQPEPYDIKIDKEEKNFVLAPFWENYHDESLNEYENEALENNLNIKIATTRVRESEAVLGTINSQRLPQLSVNPSIYPFKTISRWTGRYGSGNHLYFPLLLNWELDIFGKLSDKVKSSKYNVKISKEDLNIAKLSVSSEIAASYFNIALTNALIKNYQELLTNITETVNLKTQLYDGGIIPYDNLYTSEYEEIIYRNEYNALLKQREILLHQFAILRGITPENNSQPAITSLDYINLPFDTTKNISSDSIYNRPDVIQAEYGIKKAALDVKVARKTFLPSVNLNEMVGFETIKAGRIFNWESTVYQLGAGLLLDLYTGGYKMSVLRYNKAYATEKLHSYNNVLLNAFCEIENALSSFKADYNSYKNFERAQEKSNHYYNVANIRYQNGTGDKIDELAAKRKLILNNNSTLNAKASALVDSVDIYKSLGSSIE